MYWMILVFFGAMLSALAVTPVFMKKLREVGMVGKDIHKAGKTEVAEMGGLAIVFGLSVGVFLAIPFISGDLVSLFAAFITVLLAGIIGICDDLFGIRQKFKAWLPVFAAIPLMAVQAGEHSMLVPFVGTVDFGIFYTLILIPVGVTVLANASNMLAGYNGMEAGLGFITCGFIGVAGLLAGRPIVYVIMFATAAACLGFLKFNRLPSRIFPGDVGTFVIGSAIAAAVIAGNMEFVGLVASMPYIINGVITGTGVIRGKPIQKFSKLEAGVLVPPARSHVSSLYFELERAFRLSEGGVVKIVWLIGAVFGALSLTIVFFT